MNRFSTKIIAVLVFSLAVCFLGAAVKAQTTIGTGSQFLSTYKTDPRLLQIDQLVRLNNSLDYSLPLLNRVDFRYGISGSVWRDTIYGQFRNFDNFGLVLQPNSLRTIRAQKALKSSKSEEYSAQKADVIHRALSARYDILANLITAGELLESKKTMVQLLEKKSKLLEVTMQNGLEVRVKDVIKLEEDKTKLLIEIAELESTYRTALSAYEIESKSIVQLEMPVTSRGFISVAKMVEFANMTTSDPNNIPDITVEMVKYKYAEKEMLLDQTKDRNFFKGIQLGYRNSILDIEIPDEQRARNNFSIRADFTLPIKGANNLDYAKNKLKLQEISNEIAWLKEENATEVEQLKASLRSTVALYNTYLTKSKDNLVKKMLDTPNIQDHLSPEDWYNLQIVQQELEIEKSSLYRDITMQYVELLKTQGVIIQMPLRNYLTDELEEF